MLAACATAPAPGLTDLRTEVLAADGVPVPRFEVDAAWPDLPDDLILGQVSGVAVGPDDTVWIVQRPGSLDPTERGLADDPPTAACCRPAPPVMRFSTSGEYLGGWGGPDAAPDIDGVNQWPASMHGIFADADGTVWLAGNGAGDHVVLHYTVDGEYLSQIGRREASLGDLDRATLGNPADIFLDADAGEVLVADGYANHRVIGFAAESGAFVRFWGADGNAPVPSGEGDAPAPGDVDAAGFANPVHCVVKTSDDVLYVCDRINNRLQVYREGAAGTVEFERTIAFAPSTRGTGSVTDVALSPDETYVYVADMMNGRIWILSRETHEVLARIGRNGRYAGEFTWLHSVAADSQGNLYTGEVFNGRRAQKLVLTGVE